MGSRLRRLQFAAGDDENDFFGRSSSSLASLGGGKGGEQNERSAKEQALLRNEFNNGEETATKAKTTQQQQQQQKQLKILFKRVQLLPKERGTETGRISEFRERYDEGQTTRGDERERGERWITTTFARAENVRGSW